jgi:hypothetical protein
VEKVYPQGRTHDEKTGVCFSAKSQHFGSSQVPSIGLELDDNPSIGIEELFRDFERPEEDPKIQTEPSIESRCQPFDHELQRQRCKILQNTKFVAQLFVPSLKAYVFM